MITVKVPGDTELLELIELYLENTGGKDCMITVIHEMVLKLHLCGQFYKVSVLQGHPYDWSRNSLE